MLKIINNLRIHTKDKVKVQGGASAYIVNMPFELFRDGAICFYRGRNSHTKLERDSNNRVALMMLYTSLEAALNIKLNIPLDDTSTKLQDKVKDLMKLNNKTVEDFPTWNTFCCNSDSFIEIRNKLVHFKGSYEIYELIDRNIEKYFYFTKLIFEEIYTEKVIKEWLGKIEKGLVIRK